MSGIDLDKPSEWLRYPHVEHVKHVWENDMNELIEKLKKNEKIWSRLSDEERDCFIKVGRINCIVWGSENWITCTDSVFDPLLGAENWVYRIKKNYQPEPEYIKCKVTKLNNGFLGILSSLYRLGIYKKYVNLHEIISFPNFKDFELDNGHHVGIENIANNMGKGRTVYAVLWLKD